MKKSHCLFLYFFILINILYGVEKPIIRTGINSYGYYNLYSEKTLYPTNLKDDFYLIFENRFSNYFKFRHRSDLYYINYNKYNEDTDKLRSILYYNSLYFIFSSSKNHEIEILTKPMLNNYSGEKYFQMMNKLQYKYNLENFSFKISYSNQFTSKDNDLFYHNFISGFYWSFKKFSYIKFKSYFSIYFNHYKNENYKNVSPVKSININFEIAIDFNKINLIDFFEKKEENEFFETEQIP